MTTLFDNMARRNIDLRREIHDLHRTNSRLHRRCQQAESQAVQDRRRYEAVQKPLASAQAVATRIVERLKILQGEYNQGFSRCRRCKCWWRRK